MNYQFEKLNNYYRNLYYPYHKDSESYLIQETNEDNVVCELGLPVPPKELWLGYGDTVEQYLNGKIQVDKMLDILKKWDFSLSAKDNVLDFGCGAGRMIRWLNSFSDECEIWGTDISSDHIFWANQYLTPPFNFATTTTVPHLPFEDGYFNLIYSGSVFTHIDDLAEAWFLELRRICSKNAYLYITINDKHTIELLDTIYNDKWLSIYMNNFPLFFENKKNFEIIVGGRGPDSQVFYNLDYLKKSLQKIFEIVAVEEEAYGYQTALILKKR
ncbi:MAG: class I SAM-dependent methyltransferase [Ignavibacteria bacterium]